MFTPCRRATALAAAMLVASPAPAVVSFTSFPGMAGDTANAPNPGAGAIRNRLSVGSDQTNDSRVFREARGRADLFTSTLFAVAVPEPLGWGLLVAGLTAAGAAMRRRKRDVVMA